MTKKVLMLAAKANMIQQFNHRNIKILQGLGYEVHVATNMVDFGSMSYEENERFKQWMIDNEIFSHQVDFERRMGTLKGNIKSFRQLEKLFKENNFEFIHVHSPLGSILGRLAAKKHNVPTIYTAHGFHFFKDGPKSGWLFFFPMEWLFSFITNTLITINDEDYRLAKKYMHANKIIKIDGIGVDVEEAWRVTCEEKYRARKLIRQSLEIPENAFLISSVGELSDRKNHKVVLSALKEMSNKQRQNIYYVIAGTGASHHMLKNLADSFEFSDHFKLLGYRNDIHNINYASDLSIFPSFQEGLGLAGLEATVDGTFLIGSNRRGIADYIDEYKNGILFDPYDFLKLKEIIIQYMENSAPKLSKTAFLGKFDKKNIDKKMENIYINQIKNKIK